MQSHAMCEPYLTLLESAPSNFHYKATSVPLSLGGRWWKKGGSHDICHVGNTRAIVLNTVDMKLLFQQQS